MLFDLTVPVRLSTLRRLGHLLTDIAVQTSLDGIAWTTVGTAKHDVPVTDMTPQIMELSVSFPSTRARHVRVRATAFGKLPSWHPGAGYPSFIFCDEIKVR